eukprot:600775-Rhodomonas_salina.2
MPCEGGTRFTLLNFCSVLKVAFPDAGDCIEHYYGRDLPAFSLTVSAYPPTLVYAYPLYRLPLAPTKSMSPSMYHPLSVVLRK